MLSLWLSAGLLAGASEQPPIVVVRGDDAPDWKQSFYDRQIAEVESLIERLAPRKKPKRVEVLATEALDLIQDFPPIVVGDAVQRLKEAATARQKPIALSALKAVAERARRERRRRRDEEFILMHVL
jgi:hypothetical protein